MEENGITLGELLGLMFKKWVRLLIITASITIVGILGVKLVYNNLTEYYEVKYEYRYNSLDDDKYYDGSPFDYRTVTDYENIVKVISENDDLKGLNADKIFANGINVEEVRVTSGSGNNIAVLYDYYKMDLAKNNFKNSKQAAQFAKALIELSLKKNNEIIEGIDISYNLGAFDNAKTFEKKIHYLNKQYELLVNYYEELVTNCGSVKLANGKTIQGVLTQVKSQFDDANISSFKSIVEANRLVLDYTYSKPELLSDKINLENSKQVNLNKIDELTAKRDDLLTKVSASSFSADIEAYNNAIQELVVKNEDIIYKLDVIEDKLSNETDQSAMDLVNSIKELLNNYRDILTNETNEYKNVVYEATNSTKQIYYGSNEIVTTMGGMSFVKSAVISLFAGFFVAIIVNVICAWKPFQEEKNKIKQ